MAVWHSKAVAEERGSSTTPEAEPAAPESRRPEPHLFRILDCERPLDPPARHRLAEIDAVAIGRGALRGERVHADGQRSLELSLPDAWISTHHARLRRLLGRWLIEDAGSRNGTLVNGRAVQSAVLADGDVIECGHTFFLFREAFRTAIDTPADVVEPFALPGAPETATLCGPLERELRALARIAPTLIPVLIQGETGTGKEVLARVVHASSGRTGPLVPVNCGGLPATLVESELFGYRKGAFSDAREDRTGLVRAAAGGTLFLDEIGDLQAPAQAALLRVLQEREVLPLGATAALPVDFRLCSASHRALDQRVAEGLFRADLLARVTGFVMRLPPLRKRREDIGILIAALTRRLAPKPDAVRFHPEAARALLRHSWPLNVRELESCLGVALAVADGKPVEVAHLPGGVGQVGPGAAPQSPADATPAEPMGPDDAERRQQLTRLLGDHAGNISAVARALGKDRVQVRRWLARYRLDPASFRRS
jgi:sigma-54 dependent transcriptional regulator, acetoin dehydrogenase operon transcriptional activator AcoR